MKVNPVYTAALVFTVFLSISGIVFAQVSDWAPPNTDAPLGTVQPVIDASVLGQIKRGALGVDTSAGGTLDAGKATTGVYVNSEAFYVQQTGASSAPWAPTGTDSISTNGRIRSNGVNSTTVIQSDVLKSTGTAERTVCVELSTGKLKLCGIALGPATTFTATPSTLAAPGNSTLTWSSATAVSCVGTNFSTGPGSPKSGSVVVAVPATTTYRVTCTDVMGQSRTVARTVTVTPLAASATITATPTTLNSGQSSVIDWSSTYTTSCSAVIPPSPAAFDTGGAVSGTRTYSFTNNGSAPVTVRFEITCVAVSGLNATAQVDLTINPALPVVNFTSAPVN